MSAIQKIKKCCYVKDIYDGYVLTYLFPPFAENNASKIK